MYFIRSSTQTRNWFKKKPNRYSALLSVLRGVVQFTFYWRPTNASYQLPALLACQQPSLTSTLLAASRALLCMPHIYTALSTMHTVKAIELRVKHTLHYPTTLRCPQAKTAIKLWFSPKTSPNNKNTKTSVNRCEVCQIHHNLNYQSPTPLPCRQTRHNLTQQSPTTFQQPRCPFLPHRPTPVSLPWQGEASTTAGEWLLL